MTTLSIETFCTTTLRITTIDTEYRYAECRYAECHFDYSRGAIVDPIAAKTLVLKY